MNLAVLIIGSVVEFAKDGVRAALKFSRKSTPRELKEDFVRWNLPHIARRAPGDTVFTCAICGGVDVASDGYCPGSRDQQRARLELAHGDYVLHDTHPRAHPARRPP
jgi:hypothetical protein